MNNVGYNSIGGLNVKRLNNVGGGIANQSFLYSFDSLLTDLPASLTGATYTRAGTKYNLQNGLYVAYGANEFGTSYDVDNAAYGFLSEPAATNLLTYSSDYSNAAWTKANGSVATDTDSAFDDSDAYKFTPSATNTRHTLLHSTLAGSGVLTTFSAIVKDDGYRYLAITRNATSGTQALWVFDLQDGDIYQNGGTDYSNGAIKSVGNGHYQISVQINSATAAIRQPAFRVVTNSPSGTVTIDNIPFLADGTSGIIFSNVQMETGSVATSPIINAGSTSTRAADALTYPLSLVRGFTALKYSLISDCRSFAGGDIASITDGTANNEAYLTFSGTEAQYHIISGGVDVTQAIASDETVRKKVGYSAIDDSFLISVDGVAGVDQPGGAMPIAPDSLEIGFRTVASYLNGYLYSLRLITTNVTQTALDGYTA
jgi:hypothetical protein